MVVAAPDDVCVSHRRSCGVLTTEGSGDGDSFLPRDGSDKASSPTICDEVCAVC